MKPGIPEEVQLEQVQAYAKEHKCSLGEAYEALGGAAVRAAQAAEFAADSPSPARTEVNPRGGQSSFSCPCGWRVEVTPRAGGHFSVMTANDTTMVYPAAVDYADRGLADHAAAELALEHRVRCSRWRSVEVFAS